MSRDTNRGDFAIFAALSSLLKSARPEAEITAVSVELGHIGLDDLVETGLTRSLGCEVVGTPAPSRRYFYGPGWQWGLRLVQAEIVLWMASALGPRAFRMMPKTTRRFFEVLANADVVVAKGGSYIHAQGGWRELVFLWRMLYPIRVARTLGHEVKMLGVSIGELESPGARWLARMVLRKGIHLWVRERISLKKARDELHVAPGNVRLMPDVAFATAVRSSMTTDIRASDGGLRIGVTVRLHQFAKCGLREGRKRYVLALSEALRYFLEQDESTTVVFIPQVSDDLPIAREVAERIGIHSRIEFIEGDLNLEDLLATYSSLDVLVGARLHSVILAATVGVPSVHVIYEGSKSYGTLELLEMTEYGIAYEEIDASDLVLLLERTLAMRSKLSVDLLARVDAMRTQIEESIEYALVLQ
ncbi:MAG TPA: polysaccharide pyruvyl transferase family protein [Solirubrobacteraceae bacterium]